MKKLILSILLCCIAMSALAVPVPDLYQTTVPVASQSKSLQVIALQQALTQVFVKVSGKSAVVNAPAVQAAIANPENYLLSYSYQDGVLPNGSSSLFLQVSFGPKAVQTVLKNAQQNIWEDNRPLVLVWLADTKMDASAELIGANSGNPLAKEFKLDAKTRGLPVLFPIMDLTDLQAVSPTDVASDQINTIQKASKRYESDAVLAVNLVQNNDQQWNGTWTLLSQGTPTTWQTNGMSLDAAIKAGVNAVTNNLAAKFAVTSNSSVSAEVQLTVINVQNLSDYAAVTKYLKGLAPVKQVEVAQVQPSSLILNVTVDGGETALEQVLSLDHHLKPVMAVPSISNSDTGTGAGLVYQWIL